MKRKTKSTDNKNLKVWLKDTIKTRERNPKHYTSDYSRGELRGYKEALKELGLNPHVHTTKQLKKMTKSGLIRLVIKLEKFIVTVVYQMYKSKLPRLKTKRKALPKRKTKRKFSTKQLAAQRLFAKRAKAGTLRRKR